MSQHPPYGQPPTPGQFQRPPNYPYPSRSRGLWGWYTTRTRNVKLGIGCGTILAILLAFSCIGSALGSNNLAATQTPTPSAHQAIVSSSPTATDMPTLTPDPTQKPTQTPTPTMIPTPEPQPTQALAQPTPTSPPIQPTPTAAPSCYPLTNSGNCYEPGEYCRKADHGASGIAGDGEPITCIDNNGWRWEPSH
ncbi:MAG: hypothetical protein ACXWOX_18145 [Ktedonobacteraceae bacterium]